MRENIYLTTNYNFQVPCVRRRPGFVKGSINWNKDWNFTNEQMEVLHILAAQYSVNITFCEGQKNIRFHVPHEKDSTYYLQVGFLLSKLGAGLDFIESYPDKMKFETVEERGLFGFNLL